MLALQNWMLFREATANSVHHGHHHTMPKGIAAAFPLKHLQIVLSGFNLIQYIVLLVYKLYYGASKL